MDKSLTIERLIAWISSFFGGLAVLLVSIGLFGVMSYVMARRTNEIGLRMALGATRMNVIGMVLRESMLMVVMGIAAGVPATLAATRLISTQLFGVSATDPGRMVGAGGLLIVVAILAGLVPARRASKIEPMAALRYE